MNTGNHLTAELAPVRAGSAAVIFMPDAVRIFLPYM